MASKSSAVHSIRIPNEMWEWLSEEAKRRGITPNGLVCDLLLVGRLRADEAKLAPKPATRAAKVLGEPGQTASGFAVPVLGTFERKPYQKGTKK